MSDILDRRIDKELSGPRIGVAAVFGDNLLGHLEAQLERLSRLTAAIDLLYPGEQRAGEGSIDCAIRLLERARADSSHLPR